MDVGHKQDMTKKIMEWRTVTLSPIFLLPVSSSEAADAAEFLSGLDKFQ